MIVRGDRKSPKEIKKIFDRVYSCQMHLDRQGSIHELYEAVKEAFARDPNDMASWAPRFVFDIYFYSSRQT